MHSARGAQGGRAASAVALQRHSTPLPCHQRSQSERAPRPRHPRLPRQHRHCRCLPSSRRRRRPSPVRRYRRRSVGAARRLSRARRPQSTPHVAAARRPRSTTRATPPVTSRCTATAAARGECARRQRSLVPEPGRAARGGKSGGPGEVRHAAASSVASVIAAAARSLRWASARRYAGARRATPRHLSRRAALFTASAKSPSPSPPSAAAAAAASARASSPLSAMSLRRRSRRSAGSSPKRVTGWPIARRRACDTHAQDRAPHAGVACGMKRDRAVGQGGESGRGRQGGTSRRRC